MVLDLDSYRLATSTTVALHSAPFMRAQAPIYCAVPSLSRVVVVGIEGMQRLKWCTNALTHGCCLLFRVCYHVL